jgi:prepilin-type N-terminal cleavage/methylation domain-containing protein
MTRAHLRIGGHSGEAGFSLPELLISMSVMLLISGAATMALLKMTSTQSTIWNRTQMHAGVRGATEVLQQEVGQAGRVSLPYPTRLTGGIIAGPQTTNISQFINGSWTGSVSGIYIGEQLVVDAGTIRETVTITDVNTTAKQITAVFKNGHGSNAAVQAMGGFASGVVPTTAHLTNGSDGTHLKLYGDINADGNMVYVEYTCDTTNHFLYRNMMAWDAASKLAPTAAQVLIGNVQTNPNGTACFTYQEVQVGTNWFVTDVAITLTVQTQILDPVTKQYQQETKALLNVSPRNVFNVWEMASLGINDRVQPMPPSVVSLIAPLP